VVVFMKRLLRIEHQKSSVEFITSLDFRFSVSCKCSYHFLRDPDSKGVLMSSQVMANGGVAAAFVVAQKKTLENSSNSDNKNNSDNNIIIL